MLWSPWRSAGTEAYLALEAALAPSPSPVRSLLAATLSCLAAWWIYVPLHELLHAFACLASGGEVRELQIAPLYGGTLLERVFPFVRAGGTYAGRLSGFDTRGSDLRYLATDLAPYLLTIVAAFPLLRLARRHRSALLFGPGLVLAAAPLMGLTGDYYEMGSILVSAGLGMPRAASLRHDDLFALLSEFPVRFPEDRWVWAAAVTAAVLLGATLATGTLAAALRLPDPLGRRRGPEPTAAA